MAVDLWGQCVTDHSSPDASPQPWAPGQPPTFHMLLGGCDPQSLEVFIRLGVHHQQLGLVFPRLDAGNHLRMAQPLHILPVHLPPAQGQCCLGEGPHQPPKPPSQVWHQIFISVITSRSSKRSTSSGSRNLPPAEDLVPRHTDVDRYTWTHLQAHRCRHTDRYTRTYTGAQARAHTYRHTYRHASADTHTYTWTHTGTQERAHREYRHAGADTDTRGHIQAHTHRHGHTYRHAGADTHRDRYTWTHSTQAQTHTHTDTDTQTCRRTHTHTRKYTGTDTQRHAQQDTGADVYTRGSRLPAAPVVGTSMSRSWARRPEWAAGEPGSTERMYCPGRDLSLCRLNP